MWSFLQKFRVSVGIKFAQKIVMTDHINVQRNTLSCSFLHLIITSAESDLLTAVILSAIADLNEEWN